MPFALAVTGCASMSKAECELADWEQVGFRDGKNGDDETRLARHVEACKDNVPDQAAYQRGYQNGLVQFCTPASGYNFGIKGREYKNLCPRDAEAAFLEQYHRGSRIHEATRLVKRIRYAIQNEEILLADKKATSQDKNTARSRLQTLNRELGIAEAEKKSLLEKFPPPSSG